MASSVLCMYLICLQVLAKTLGRFISPFCNCACLPAETGWTKMFGSRPMVVLIGRHKLSKYETYRSTNGR